MGIQRENGYSASVEAFLVIGEQRLKVAKTGRDSVVLVEPCELPLGTECELVTFVDGRRNSRSVVLDDGASLGQREVRYSVAVPI
jgi:hypothetical protein